MESAVNHKDPSPLAPPQMVSAAAVAGTGLTALDRIYALGRERHLEALGGSCGNVLVSLAMLGHPVAPVVALGNDAHGDYLADQFRRAGCETHFVFRRNEGGSPVIVEHIDPYRALHSFSFECPETLKAFPRWRTIDEDEVRSALSTLEKASVFYTDRLSPAIVTAMEAARDAGALIFFEPATRGEESLFARALRTVSILKLSDDTAGAEIASDKDASLTTDAVVIRTHGALGLTVSLADTERFFPAKAAPRLIDTCGSGDMVTTGMLDYLLRSWLRRPEWTAQDTFAAIETGQRLAALNCAFAGARGLFHALGGGYVRLGLEEGLGVDFVAHAMSVGPFEGY